MKNRIAAFVLVMTIFILVGVGCGQQQPIESTPSSESVGLELTLQELAAYNGKDGNPAYIAVDGVIYDVTDSPKWKDGEHNGYTAGQDLTEAIKQKSPHGVSKLSNVLVVGKIKE